MNYQKSLEAKLKKKCTKCREDKALKDFYKTFDKGKWRYRPRCKSCMVQDATNYVKKKRS